MRAIILSAGYGTRLWPLTEDRTKPAIPILGKPLVGYVAEYLSAYGCDEVVVNLHHRPESVRRALGDGSEFGVTLYYVEEPEILGTSGALDNARALLDGGDTFVVINGKIITDIDLNAALATHRRTKALATLVLLPNVECERFSVVKAADGLLRGFGGMPVKANFSEVNPPLKFTGIHLLEPGIFDYVPPGVFSHSTTDVYPQALAKGETIAVHVAEGNWHELSTLRRYLDISLQLMAQKGDNVTVGRDCRISTHAEISDAVLWDNVEVAEGARVKRAVLADNVKIAASETIEDAAVVCAALVRGRTAPEKALKGKFQGDNFVVPLTG
jgi:NDP-sugar pyrophosphorylase family protein